MTVTHAEITRFFMTIPEAARLVLLAGAYATGGDVFVLDMGKPQKMMDIAHKMIALSGRTVKDPKTGIGDIAVEITGVRRQGFWHQWQLNLRESLAHLVGFIMRRVVCDASVAFQASFV